MRSRRGFTLIEMLIALAIGVLLLALAAPSFREYILMQRLKGINAQIVTDLAYARSEAVSRGVPVRVKVTPWNATSQMSCYVIFSIDTIAVPSPVQQRNRCDCTLAPGAACGPDAVELRTVQVPGSLQVFISTGNAVNVGNQMIFDPRTGGMTATNIDGAPLVLTQFNVEASIDTPRKFRDQVGLSGRTSVCIPPGSRLSGEAC